MSEMKFGINGTGRVGMAAIRDAGNRYPSVLHRVNNRSYKNPVAFADHISFDSHQGVYIGHEVTAVEGGRVQIDDQQPIDMTVNPDAGELDWAHQFGTGLVVIESTGQLLTAEAAYVHIRLWRRSCCYNFTTCRR